MGTIVLPALAGDRACERFTWGDLTTAEVAGLLCMQPRTAPDGSMLPSRFYAGGVVLTTSSRRGSDYVCQVQILARRSWPAGDARAAGSKPVCIASFRRVMDPRDATDAVILNLLLDLNPNSHDGQREFAPMFAALVAHLRQQFSAGEAQTALFETLAEGAAASSPSARARKAAMRI